MTISLPEDLERLLAIEAAARGVSIEELVIEILRCAVELS